MSAPTSRSSRSQVRDLSDLLRLTECADVTELEELVDAQLQMEPSELYVRMEDGQVEVHTGATACILDLPITLGRFWRVVDDLDADLLHLAEVEQLPDADAGEDATEVLADFLGASVPEFVSHVGGRWCPQEPDDLTGLNEVVHRWYSSGHPLQVALGFGMDEVVVAEPIVTAPGLASPGGVAQGRATSVRLRRADTLRRMSEAVRDMEAWVQSQLTFCPCCRSTLGRGSAADTCSECLAAYYGMIFD